MPAQTLVISDFKTGLETDRLPFNINNDAFPTLYNAYVWRGRILKKRGTMQLGRLQVNLVDEPLGTTNGSGDFTGNIFTILGLSSTFPNASVVPGSLSIVVGSQTFTEPVPPDGTLSNGAGGTGTIDYATGALTLVTDPTLATTDVTITFGYYPVLPVMGLEDFLEFRTIYPALVAFDTVYSYEFTQPSGPFYNVNFYKISGHPFMWHGTEYEQFWSCNYENALWATNGVPGFNFGMISTATIGTPTSTFTIPLNGLAVGDYVFINEVAGPTAGVNGVSAPITAITNTSSTTTITIATPLAAGSYASGGIVQFLTYSNGTSGDGIKWYDGDPTTPSSTLGWVNFAPPLDNTLTPQYLVGANLIVPFKNRLLFMGCYLQTSAEASPTYFSNMVVYSQDGTAFYADPVPIQQKADYAAWFSNVAGKGGDISAPVDQKIMTAFDNRDTLLLGMENQPMKIVFTSNDDLPFVFQTVSAELGALSTFSGIALDTGILYIGSYGIAMATEERAQRIDLPILDQVFSISNAQFASRRVTAVRDFRNEFIYFSYPGNQEATEIPATALFPNQTLLFNYRDNTWAIFGENYTHYGTFRRNVNYTWATLPFDTWSDWTNPWNFGQLNGEYPDIIGGNQQGFVMIKDVGTAEANSQYVAAFDVTTLTVTSPNHNLNTGDFIEMNGAIGLDNFNDIIYLLAVVDQNNFVLLTPSVPTGTYVGGAVYRRIVNFNVKTKQFPIYWDANRQTRVGTQRYFLDKAEGGQVTVNIYCDQSEESSNDPLISSSIISSNVILTGPEPTKPNQANQAQIWHRMANSFIGDTVQIGFSLSRAQMFDPRANVAQFGLHAIALDLYPGPVTS